MNAMLKRLLEAPGIDPGTSRMLSERSTIWATPPIYLIWKNKNKGSRISIENFAPTNWRFIQKSSTKKRQDNRFLTRVLLFFKTFSDILIVVAVTWQSYTTLPLSKFLHIRRTLKFESLHTFLTLDFLIQAAIVYGLGLCLVAAITQVSAFYVVLYLFLTC